MKFLLLFTISFVLSRFSVVIAEITDKDLEELLGVDLKAARKVSWKDWANSNPEFSHPLDKGPGRSMPCRTDVPVQGVFQTCCNSSQNCDAHSNVECRNGTCLCLDGYLPSISESCERTPRLGESCSAEETCRDPLATCINGTCDCANDTVRVNDDCVVSVPWRQAVEQRSFDFTNNGCFRPIGFSKNFGFCCTNNTNCNTTVGLSCVAGMCDCEDDHFLDDDGTACVHRPKRELDDNCLSSKDNCYAAFAWCGEGTGICLCRPGFTQVNDTCRPQEYTCPYKRPWTPKGRTIPWPCLPDSNNTGCPEGYTCLRPASGPRPRFLSPSGHEQSYCCPPVPDLNMTAIRMKFIKIRRAVPDIFDDVCLHGKACIDSCPTDGYFGYYNFPGIGRGTVMCPNPCLRHPVKQPVVRNGKCVGYERYKIDAVELS